MSCWGEWAFLLATKRALGLIGDSRNVTSSGNDSYTHPPLHGLLASAKSALETLVQYLVIDQVDNGIRVNAVNSDPFCKDNY